MLLEPVYSLKKNNENKKLDWIMAKNSSRIHDKIKLKTFNTFLNTSRKLATERKLTTERKYKT